MNGKRASDNSLHTDRVGEPHQVHPEFAGQLIAELFGCSSCGAWWGSSDPAMPLAYLILRLVEPDDGRFPWSAFYGWRQPAEAHTCPACTQQTAVSRLSLNFDNQGQVAWPPEAFAAENTGAAGQGDPFQSYIEASPRISENIEAIAAREAKRQANVWAYTADIDELREQLDALRDAFKDTVYQYGALLPPGWRVTGDFDQWIKGRACAGFLHGEINPDHSLMVGGRCTTLAELEMALDRLHHFVCEMSC